MGSPASRVAANLCVEIIEKSAITTSTTPPKIWKRYVDDSLISLLSKNTPPQPFMTP